MHRPPSAVVSRRALLALSAAAVVVACSPGSTRREETEVPTVSYGDDESQFFEVYRPGGRSRGVVVVIHGGFWKAQYDLTLGQPLAVSLADEGWTAINLEYRRVDGGGGWPATFDDVAAGLDKLADVEDLDTERVITLGHSAGGHLAVWAAGRSQLDRDAWNRPVVEVTAAVSQAGVLDLDRAVADDLGAGAVVALMGGQRTGSADLAARYADADPLRRVPLDVPVRCVHAGDDTNVPIDQSRRYVAAATAAGADATLTEVEGDHFTLIDPSSDAWATTLKLLEDL